MNISKDYRHLELATRADHMQSCLATHAERWLGEGVRLAAVEVPRVFPRPDGGFVLQYRLIPEGVQSHRTDSLLCCGYLPPVGGSLPQWALEQNPRVVVTRDPQVAIPILPYDPGLPALDALLDRQQITNLLHRIEVSQSGEFAGAHVTAVQILGYRLERRCTVRLELRQGSPQSDGAPPTYMVAKTVRPGRLQAMIAAKQWLDEQGLARADAPELSVPETLAVATSPGICVFAHAPGQSLHKMLQDERLEDACRLVGSALTRFHGLAPGDRAAFTCEDELKTLMARVDATCTIFPVMASVMGTVVRELKSRMPAEVPPPSLIHRDFYDKQVLYRHGHITMLDFDNLASGDAALDYGNFRAHLVLRSLQHPDAAPLLQRADRAFCDAYRTTESAFTRRAAWWQVATLTRLAALYALRPRWRSLAEPLLQAAHARVTDLNPHGVSMT